MAIDLDFEIPNSVAAKELIEGTRAVLNDLVGIEPPQLHLERMLKGERMIADETEALGESDSLYLLSYVGRDEEVAITIMELAETEEINISVAVSATRTAPEYALGVAAAVHLAERFDAEIRDGFRFWTGSDVHVAKQLLDALRIDRKQESFDQACERLVGARAA